MEFLIFLVVLFAIASIYIYIGTKIAARAQNAIIDAARLSYKSPTYRIQSARSRVIATMLLWPFLVPFWGASKTYKSIMKNVYEQFDRYR